MTDHASRMTERHQSPITDDPAVNGQIAGDGWTVPVPTGMPLQSAAAETGEGPVDLLPAVQFAPGVEVQLFPGTSRDVELPVGGPSVLLGKVFWIGTNSHLATRLLLNGSILTTGRSYTFAGTRGGSDVTSPISAGGNAKLSVTNTTGATVRVKILLGALDLLHEQGASPDDVVAARTATSLARLPMFSMRGGSGAGGATSEQKGGHMYERTEVSPMYRTAAESSAYPTGGSPLYPTGVYPMYPTGGSSMTPTEMSGLAPADKALWARVSSSYNGSGREKVGWAPEIWDRIDRAVRDEIYKGVAWQVLPKIAVPGALTVPADKIVEIREFEQAPVALSVDEALFLTFTEDFVEIALTQQQIASEETLHTAVTLVTRGAKELSRFAEIKLWSGDALARQDLLFTERKVSTRGALGPAGLANVARNDPAISPPLRTIPVNFVDDETYAGNTVAAVAEAYSELHGSGYNGPFVLVFPPGPATDAFSPLKDTLIFPAQLLCPLVGDRLYVTDALPQNIEVDVDGKLERRDVGLLLSVGTDTVALAIEKAATTEFVGEDTAGRSRLRLYQRYLLKDIDTQARVAFLFQLPKKKDSSSQK